MGLFDSAIADRFLLAGFNWHTRNAVRLEDVHEGTPRPPRNGRTFLYVHIPFCEVLCPFCSFHRVQFRDALARRYFAALRQEIRLYHQLGFRFAGAYIGGGTPTVAPQELAETLALLGELFGVRDISVETNPRDLRPDLMDLLARHGVSRLSVGVQSFDDRLLKEMDRYDKYGSSSEIREHLRTAAPRFSTLNVDMLFNLPHQDAASLDRDLDAVLALPANQVSFYPLMTAKSTATAMGQHMGQPSAAHLRPAYARILQRLRPSFAPQSAWCFSRGQNNADEYIVDADQYLGVGSGAFSYVDGSMYSTTFSLHGYIERIGRGLTGITARRQLTLPEQMKHAFLVRLFGLRLEKSFIEARFGRAFYRHLFLSLAAMKLAGALRETDSAYELTDRGMYYWVRMMSAFFESVNTFREKMRAHIHAELEESHAA